MYILELRRGWPFETLVCSPKSGLLSSYDGQLRKLNYAWQESGNLWIVVKDVKTLVVYDVE